MRGGFCALETLRRDLVGGGEEDVDGGGGGEVALAGKEGFRVGDH